MLRPASLLSTKWTFDAPLWPATSLPSAGACYRALRRLPGQDLHLLEERVFQDAPCPRVYFKAYANDAQTVCGGIGRRCSRGAVRPEDRCGEGVPGRRRTAFCRTRAEVFLRLRCCALALY